MDENTRDIRQKKINGLKAKKIYQELFIRNKGGELIEILYSNILDKLLEQCIDEYFPELMKRKITIGYVLVSENYGGAKSGNRIILFLSKETPLENLGLKWIVCHELCHFINLYEPDKIFKEKMPKNIYNLWIDLTKKGELICDRGNPKINKGIN